MYMYIKENFKPHIKEILNYIIKVNRVLYVV